MSTIHEAAAAATFARRDQAQSLNAAREEQREACAQAIQPKPGEADVRVLTRIAFSQGAVRRTPLDATPLADTIASLRHELATERTANALEVAALQAQREAEILAHRETMRERDALREALERCDALFAAIRDDWTDPRSECREGRDVCSAALATPTGEKP